MSQASSCVAFSIGKIWVSLALFLPSGALTLPLPLPYVAGMDNCPFCHMPSERIITDRPLCSVVRDGFPISKGHTLIIPKRHITSFFECSEEERAALMGALDAVKRDLDHSLKPDGYNIGINDGPAAGQTIPHLHIHLIPRYIGDQTDPRGGVRWIFPDKARYWP